VNIANNDHTPEFELGAYSIKLDITHGIGAVPNETLTVGYFPGYQTTKATDQDGDTLTYAITNGVANYANFYSIDTSTGQLSITKSAYELPLGTAFLVVEADDGNGNKATTTVFIFKNRFVAFGNRENGAVVDLHDVDLNDIKQDQVGDCYFLATIGMIVQKDPNIIKNLITDAGDGKNFTVVIKGTSYAVTYDPARGRAQAKLTGDSNFNNHLEVWPSLMESAYIKHMQSVRGNPTWNFPGDSSASEVAKEIYGKGFVQIPNLPNLASTVKENIGTHKIILGTHAGGPLPSHWVQGHKNNNHQVAQLYADHQYVVVAYYIGIQKDTNDVVQDYIELYNPHGYGNIFVKASEFNTIFGETYVLQN
jgi:Calpain family cysteine protease